MRADKKGRIDREKFNFLESLLVFRTMEILRVPAESSVSFGITRQEEDSGVCLLIHIDNQQFPLFESGEVRPDYLAVYLHGGGCICTIIEMKSRAGRNLKHGLEQIKTLADRLKREFSECLPRKFDMHVQGILLSQFNAEVPGALIAQMAASGLTILPIQYGNRAELFPYISQRNTLKTKFINSRRHQADQGPLEHLLSCASLQNRLIEPQTASERGLCISYVLSEEDEAATLTVRKKRCVFLIDEVSTRHADRIRRDIENNGLQEKFLVEALEAKNIPTDVAGKPVHDVE